MRAQAVAAAFLLVIACNRDDRGAPATPTLDASQLENASGEVTLSDGGALSYNITSERYKQWYAAQQSLDHATAAKFGTILHPDSPSAASIEQATGFLERNPRTKLGIEHSGMSVRDFVQMTVALQQQFHDAAHASGETYPQDLPYYVPPPLDTTMPPPPVSNVPMTPLTVYTPPPAYTPVQPVDTSAYGTRRDSVVDTSRRIIQTPARPPVVTSVPMPRIDTAAPKRDTVLPPVPPRPKPDSVSTGTRDTTRRSPTPPALRDSPLNL
jgi:hypothetical protein